LNRLPVAMVWQGTDTLARKFDSARLAEAETVEHLVEHIAGQGNGDPAGTHVAGFGDDAGQIELAIIVYIANGTAIHPHPAWRSVYQRGRRELAGFQRRRHGYGLHRG